MKKYIEALEALECGYLDTADIEQYMQAICESLKKQIPKKVKREFLAVGGAITCIEAEICPNCGAKMESEVTE